MGFHRFPKAAYVRRLESLYGELSAWRDVFKTNAHYAWDEQKEIGFQDRDRVLADAQRHIMDAVYMIEGIKRVP